MNLADRQWVVLKFGGTSVSTVERWNTIASIATQKLNEGLRPFVVCSALSGVSNLLEQLLEEARRGQHDGALEEIKRKHRELAQWMQLDAGELLHEEFEELSRLALGASLIREVSPKLHARVMAMGELMSTRLGVAHLQKSGVSIGWRDARAMLRAQRSENIHTHRHFLSATCHYDPDHVLQKQLAGASEHIVLTQGFIATDDEGQTVLLGRGGSDTSAAYFAAKLQAQCLEIWTDVPGMFTANPRQVPSARLLRQLDYDEARELATMGAKVLHPRCIDPVREYHIPLHIRNTEDPSMEGTVISSDAPDFGAQVKAISAKTGITLISMNTIGMWQQVGFLADIFGVFKRHGLSIDLVGTSEVNVTVSLDPMANALEPEKMQALLEDLNQHCEARAIHPCAAVSLVGHHIRSILHRLAPALEVFVEQHIYLVSQAASDLNITFVVDEEQADRLVRKLHALLFQSRKSDELLGATWRTLIGEHEEVEAFQNAWWRNSRKKLLELATNESPLYVYNEATLRESVEALQSLKAVDRIFYAMKANPHPEILKLFHASGLGFECVSPGELEHVRNICPDVDASKLLFTPNFAPAHEYELGFAQSGWLTLDNMYPLESWPELFQGRDVLVRVDPGQGRGHHKYVRTAGPQSKFGVSPSELDRLARLADTIGFRVVGLHSHVGSGVRDAQTWADTAVFLESWSTLFPEAKILNLGGGLGVPERANHDSLDMDEMARLLNLFKDAHPEFELWLEPGRFLVANAGVLLATVTQLKQKADMHYVGLNTGMNSLLRPALYGAYHEILNLTRLDDPYTMAAEVVGPICETGDVLGHARRLPNTEEGDVLLIATAGAYGHAMSSHYNLRSPADEYFLRHN